MCQPDSFDEVIGRLHEGDEQAAAEIFRRFAGRLIGVSRSRLDARMRQKVDPDDVVQSVFRSFFVRQADGQFELENWDSLWSLLVRITLRKCGRQIVAFHAERRDLRREVKPAVANNESYRQREAIAREPTPEEVVSLSETLEILLSGLNGRQRQMLVLRLQGCTAMEISRQSACTEWTVHRLLARVREKLRQLEGEVRV